MFVASPMSWGAHEKMKLHRSRVGTPANEEIESGRRDSNSRRSAWKADALPTELLPRKSGSMPWAHATRPPSEGRNDEPARLTMTCAAPNLRTDYSAFFPGSSDFSTFGQRYAPLR
jgi:hypothetical protein